MTPSVNPAVFPRGFLALILVGAVAAPAAAQEAESPIGLAEADRLLPLERVHAFQAPAIDAAAARAAADSGKRRPDERPRPLQYAIPFEVELTTQNAGTWESVDRGPRRTSVWRLLVRAPGALSVNLGFTRFWLPRGAQLSVYAPDHREGEDPSRLRQFTPAANDAHRQLWTPIVPDADTVVVELSVPEEQRDRVELTLGFVNAGFREIPEPKGVSGSCNVDVVCPQGDPYRDQIRSVAVMSLNGRSLCTGSLVNNTGAKRPLFITADHCGLRAGNAATLVAYWNFQNSFCRPVGSGQSGSDGDGTLNQFNTGSNFLATFSTSDVTLAELDDPPQASFNVYLAGWDRRPGPFSDGAVGIHHPAVAEKRISLSNTSTTDDGGTHHRIQWRPGIGVTEPGSSGSPVYTKQGRLIGQLTGGASACNVSDADKWDVYGKLSRSWDGGGSSSSRVRDHLDPAGTAPLTLDGRNWNDGGGDTLPPSTSVTSPSSGATVSGTVTVTASASDNVGVTRVELLVDGVPVATDTGAPYSFQWNSTAVGNGSHTLRSRAFDAAGNAGTSAAVGVNVDNTGGTAIVELYQHCSFGGWKASFTAAGSYSTAQIVGAGGVNNDASSIKIAPGFKVTLFNGNNQTGTSITLTAGDTACFVAQGFNDVLSSLRIEPDTGGGPIVQLFQHCNFGGWQADFTATGNYSTAQLVAAGGVNNDASSIKIAPGFTATLFNGDNQTGSSITLSAGDTACFVARGFNDVLSSLRIQASSARLTRRPRGR